MAETRPPHQRIAFWILAIALCRSGLAHAGTGVWTSGGPYGGSVWSVAIDPSNPSRMYAATDVGIVKSIDAGATWAAANIAEPTQPGAPSFTLAELNVRAVALDPSTPSTLYAATTVGVYKSTNFGGTWAIAKAGMPFGMDNITALAIDPTHPSTIYAGMAPHVLAGSGPGGGVFKSVDAGDNWTPANEGLNGNIIVTVLAIDAKVPGTLYAGTFGSGIFKSLDAGSHWSSIGVGPYVNGLAIDPTTPTTLYAATDVGVFKSMDSGNTWGTGNVGLTNLAVTAVAVSPTTPSTVYVGTYRSLYAGTEGGIFKSIDSGATWVAAQNGPSSSSVYALAIKPATPATLYAGTDGDGIFKSVDSGASWVATNTGFAQRLVSALAIAPATPSTLFAGTFGRSGGKVFRSMDSGSSWVDASTGLPNLSMNALAVDPTTSTTLYAGTEGGGVFKSTNSGGTWAAANSGLTTLSVNALAIDPTTPSTLYAGTSSDGGIFKSTNSGATWANAGLTNLAVIALAIDPTAPSILYAGTNLGVFRSADSAGTWTAANAGAADLIVRTLVVDPRTPSTIYAGGDAFGVFKSADSGATWASAGQPVAAVYALVLEPTSPSTAYAGLYRDGVFKSTDSGATWAAANGGLPHQGVYALAFDPSGPRKVYAGLFQGSVWQSIPPESNLAITLSDSPDPVTGTTPLTYTIGVSNGGPDPAGSVSVSQTLPVGVVFNGASGDGWSCAATGGAVTCTRPSLPVGPAPNITVRVTPGPTAAVLVSSATVSSAETDPSPANNSASQTTTVNEALVWLGTRTMTVGAGSGRFVVNGNVTYTIALTNSGSNPQGDNAGHEFQDVLPSSLGLVSATATSGTTAVDLASNTVSWDGSIPSGGSVTITINARINPTVALGTTVANQGTAYYDADGNGVNEAAASTDDPGQPGPNDATTFVVVSPPMALYTLPPCRLVDTRNEASTFGGPPLVANANRTFPVVDRCGIPATAHALSVNLTVLQPTTAGNLRLYPSGSPLPNASSINYVAGQTRANSIAVPLNGLGELAVFCAQASGTAHIILDVNGYFE